MSGDSVTTPLPPAERPRPTLDDYLGGGRLAELPSPLRHPVAATVWSVRALFGIVSLIVLLAILAAIPLVNFLVLGYLLEAEGRLARTGKLRGAIPLLSIAPRLGAIALCVWLWVLPLRLLANAAADARLIDPAGKAAARLDFFTSALAVLIGVHICFALARGGSFACFFRPLKNVRWTIRQLRSGGYFDRAANEIAAFVSGLRLRHHFLLGVRGFCGGLSLDLRSDSSCLPPPKRRKGCRFSSRCWAACCSSPSWRGSPFCKRGSPRRTDSERCSNWRAVRRLFCRAPLAWLLGDRLRVRVGTAAVSAQDFSAAAGRDVVRDAGVYRQHLSGPPRDRLGVRAGDCAKSGPAWFGTRWSARALMLPLLVLFVVLLFFTQFIGQHGKGVLFEHHAFLLPVPF